MAVAGVKGNGVRVENKGRWWTRLGKVLKEMTIYPDLKAVGKGEHAWRPRTEKEPCQLANEQTG